MKCQYCGTATDAEYQCPSCGAPIDREEEIRARTSAALQTVSNFYWAARAAEDREDALINGGRIGNKIQLRMSGRYHNTEWEEWGRPTWFTSCYNCGSKMRKVTRYYRTEGGMFHKDITYNLCENCGRVEG